ncbi:MAG TPA: acyl carrier protein [Amycolatopsis sp.]|uniref:acyl carrier protein n=1 Tax=Amycolatopsis sp. TaxID=37632 RepID=UPI002B49C898|nr:acyl carrier protein [Amycolatopsis sp.]HKS47100.1 acyl carrier protein [Amycolatopsis sp.]
MELMELMEGWQMTQNVRSAVDREELRAIVAEVIERPESEVTDDADFVQELEVDSLTTLELVVRLEKRYGIKVQDEDFTNISSLDSTYALVTGKLAGV